MPLVVCSLPSPTFLGLGLIIGNSIAANMFADAPARTTLSAGGRIIASQAVSGHTIAQQLTAWNANPFKGARECTHVYLEPGVNDVIAGTDAATILAALAAFRANIRAANPFCRIVQQQITPCRTYSGMSAPKETVRLAVNEGLLLVSESNVVTVPAIASLDDGTGALAASRDSGDHLHLNALGSQDQATGSRAACG